MAKRSKLAQKNKDRSGCMSGIVSIFAFRHGRITRQLLSDHATHITESTIGKHFLKYLLKNHSFIDIDDN